MRCRIPILIPLPIHFTHTHIPYSSTPLTPIIPSIVGTKKTLWVNFQEICAMMRRSSEHVFQFMMAELGTEGSIDGSKRLVIRYARMCAVHAFITCMGV
ncbi:hypothetical protein EON64_13435 [archaeon]|nr:MAG: hypothetical protein EON64_13435 [archaeon]